MNAPLDSYDEQRRERSLKRVRSFLVPLSALFDRVGLMTSRDSGETHAVITPGSGSTYHLSLFSLRRGGASEGEGCGRLELGWRRSGEGMIRE